MLTHQSIHVLASWPLLAMPMLGVSVLLVFSLCREFASKPILLLGGRITDKVSGLEKTGDHSGPFLSRIAIIFKSL